MLSKPNLVASIMEKHLPPAIDRRDIAILIGRILNVTEGKNKRVLHEYLVGMILTELFTQTELVAFTQTSMTDG